MSLTAISDGLGQIAGLRSIRQSVQNGQFSCRLAQDASDLFVASHTNKGIERLLEHVVVTTLAIDINAGGGSPTSHGHEGLAGMAV
jgi:hypothetical protein